jgi:replicative DNA helicase
VADVVGYLESKGIPTKRADAHNIHTACVFCGEDPTKRGRLYVNVDPEADPPGLYKCFRCQAKGNLVTLKRHFGDPLNTVDIDLVTRTEILTAAVHYYIHNLVMFAEVLAYLKGPQRRLTINAIGDHQLGYAPMAFDQDMATGTVTVTRPNLLYRHLRDAGWETAAILATGLCVEGRDDRIVDAFAGMITIPYFVAGGVVAIRGRTWPYLPEDFDHWKGERYQPSKAKYRTLTGDRARLYNSDACWTADDEITIAEGEFDCIALEQHGYHAVGVPGATIWQDTWDHYFDTTRRVYVVFDRDPTGETAGNKLVERLGAKARRIHLSEPGVKCDPTDWFGTHTADDFNALLAAARKGDMLVTVGDAIDEFRDVHAQSGLRFAWPLLDEMIAPGLQPGQVMVLLAKTNTGKGHPLDTEVPTPHGTRRWGDLCVGDKIFGSDGKPTKVVEIFDRGVLPVYEVGFSDGTTIEADGDHIWPVQYRYGRRREWTRKNLTTAELVAEDLRRGPEWRYAIPICEPVRYDERDLPVDPYTLGALIANGYISGSTAVLSTPDSDVAERVAAAHEITKMKKPEGACPAYVVKGIIGRIRELGLKVLSPQKFIPEPYLNASVEQRIALLQGLFDGDGSSKERRASAYFTSSPRLANDVAQLVSSLGGTVSQNWSQRPGQRPEGVLSVMLPDSISAFSSQRKSRQAVRTYRTQPRRAIVSIEPVGEKQVRCITVDAPDSLYLIGRGHVVTHNTLALLNFMHRMRMAPEQRDLKFLFISLEQTRGEWWDRARRIHRFYNLHQTEEDAARWWRDHILLVDRNRVTEAQLLTVIEDFTYEMGAPPDAIFMDYLGYFSRSFRGEAYMRTSDAIMSVKALAKQCGIPVVMPHQVNRTGHDGQEISADTGRESGVVEETADFVLTMWSPDNLFGRAEEEKTGQVHLRIGKSRHGGRGALLNLQFAPISLALVPEGDPLCGQARREVSWVRPPHRETWEQAVYRHRCGIEEGTLVSGPFAPSPKIRQQRWV